jgi:hypothetical protein
MDHMDLPHAGLTAEAIANALVALGVKIGPGPDNPSGDLLDERVPELLGALACTVDGYTVIVTHAGPETIDRAMWVKGYLTAIEGAVNSGMQTDHRVEIVCATVGVATFAAAEVVRGADPSSTYTHVAADLLRVASTMTMLAGAVDEPEAVAHAEVTGPKLRGMFADARRQIINARGALVSAEKRLRAKGFDL